MAVDLAYRIVDLYNFVIFCIESGRGDKIYNESVAKILAAITKQVIAAFAAMRIVVGAWRSIWQVKLSTYLTP